jgi:hypothetical protein
MAKTPEQEDLNTSMIAIAGVIGAVIIFLMIVALQAWYYNVETAEMYRKVVAPAADELSSVTAEQQGQLNSYRMIDSQKRIVAIPIDRAMGIVVRDLTEGRNPLPVPSSQPTTAATSQPTSATSRSTSAASQPGGASHE